MVVSGTPRPVHPLVRAVAIEFQDPASWRERVFRRDFKSRGDAQCPARLDPGQRSGSGTPQERRNAPNLKLRDQIMAALDKLAWDKLNRDQQLDLMRVYEVVLNRFGHPGEDCRKNLIARFDPYYPARDRDLNTESASC